MIGVNQLPGPAKSSAIDRAPIPPPNDVPPQIARGRGGVGKGTNRGVVDPHMAARMCEHSSVRCSELHRIPPTVTSQNGRNSSG
jgi:hypothetical protein